MQKEPCHSEGPTCPYSLLQGDAHAPREPHILPLLVIHSTMSSAELQRISLSVPQICTNQAAEGAQSWSLWTTSFIHRQSPLLALSNLTQDGRASRWLQRPPWAPGQKDFCLSIGQQGLRSSLSHPVLPICLCTSCYNDTLMSAAVPRTDRNQHGTRVQPAADGTHSGPNGPVSISGLSPA